MTKLNRLAKTIASLKSKLPQNFHSAAITLAFNTQVKYAFTSGIKIHELEREQSVFSIKNRMRVQNHIGGVHACGMALLAESATGGVFGMNVPDKCLPLLKSMKIDYTRRAKGDLKAVATLSEDQRESIYSSEKGEVVVPVVVTDSEGKEPIKAEMTWAWVPKNRL